MDKWIISQTVDLAHSPGVGVWNEALMLEGDARAHTWTVRVLKNGKAANLSGGKVTAFFNRADGAGVLVTGSLSGSTATVVLDPACYAVPGPMTGILRVTAGGETVTLSVLRFIVGNGPAGTVVDPGSAVPSLEALLAAYDETVAAAAEARSAAGAANAVADSKANALVTVFDANPAVIYPDENSILKPVSVLTPVQAGSGDPSPENIRPISGWTGAELTRCGKNLACSAVTNTTGDGITVKRDGGSELIVYGVAENTIGREGFETFLPAGTYTYSLGEIGNITRFEIAIGDTPITHLFGNDSATFTLDKPAVVKLNMIFYEGVDCGTADNPTRIKAQLEKSSYATEYAPYRGDSYAINFGQTVYGGRVDWNAGVLTVDRAMRTYDGSNYTWKPNNGSSDKLFYLEPDGENTDILMCSHAPVKSDVPRSEIGVWCDPAYRYTLHLNLGTLTDISGFAALLAASPVQIAYKLATPTTIQLTPTLIAALAGVNTVYGDGGALEGSYNKSLHAAFEELKNAILSMGGNV